MKMWNIVTGLLIFLLLVNRAWADPAPVVTAEYIWKINDSQILVVDIDTQSFHFWSFDQEDFNRSHQLAQNFLDVFYHQASHSVYIQYPTSVSVIDLNDPTLNESHVIDYQLNDSQVPYGCGFFVSNNHFYFCRKDSPDEGYRTTWYSYDDEGDLIDSDTNNLYALCRAETPVGFHDFRFIEEYGYIAYVGCSYPNRKNLALTRIGLDGRLSNGATPLEPGVGMAGLVGTTERGRRLYQVLGYYYNLPDTDSLSGISTLPEELGSNCAYRMSDLISYRGKLLSIGHYAPVCVNAMTGNVLASTDVGNEIHALVTLADTPVKLLVMQGVIVVAVSINNTIRIDKFDMNLLSDFDGDGIVDALDVCESISNAANQSNYDEDLVGDLCDDDDDNDGLPDSYEVASGLNSHDEYDAGFDHDRDLVSTLEEYRSGTDPFDNSSVPQNLVTRFSESFEAGVDRNLLSFSDTDWTRISGGASEGSYSVKSTAQCALYYENAVVIDKIFPQGRFSFDYYKNNSNYSDDFILRVDGRDILRSGLTYTWESYSVELDAGRHNIELAYRINNTVSCSLSGYAKVDNLVFTPHSLMPDYDMDGTVDAQDDYPLDPKANKDTDGDGQNDFVDNDDDNDGLVDKNDAFPLDASESTDTDGDGRGDNTDNCPLNRNPSQIDSNQNGQGNACDRTDIFPLTDEYVSDTSVYLVQGDAYPRYYFYNGSVQADPQARLIPAVSGLSEILTVENGQLILHGFEGSIFLSVGSYSATTVYSSIAPVAIFNDHMQRNQVYTYSGAMNVRYSMFGGSVTSMGPAEYAIRLEVVGMEEIDTPFSRLNALHIKYDMNFDDYVCTNSYCTSFNNVTENKQLDLWWVRGLGLVAYGNRNAAADNIHKLSYIEFDVSPAATSQQQDANQGSSSGGSIWGLLWILTFWRIVSTLRVRPRRIDQ